MPLLNAIIKKAKMKILVVGKDTMLHWPQNVCDALDTMGHQNNLFLINHLGVFNDTLISLLKKFKKPSSEELLAHYFRQRIDEFKPDVIMLISAFFMPQSLYDVLKNLPQKPYIIGWSGDAFNQDVTPLVHILDKLYCTDSFFVDVAHSSYGWSNVEYLPLAYNPKIFFPSNTPNEKRKDTLFIGSSAPDRVEILKSIQTPITLIGSAWKKHPLSLHTIVAKNIDLKKIVPLYQSCRAVLNMKQGANVRNGLNMRSFEATACGALMIHDNVVDIEKHFAPNKEILVYNNTQELNELLQHIEKNPQSFYEIARKGMQRTLLEHTYQHRMSLVLDNLS
jgi:spore maturation protein CgeB